MKRRLVSEFLQRYDTCVFCASRSTALVALKPTSSSIQYRCFTSTLNTAQTPAAQRKNDDDDDGQFSMLKQHAGLSFPARAKPNPEPKPRTSDPAATQGGNRPFDGDQKQSKTGRTSSWKTINPQRQRSQNEWRNATQPKPSGFESSENGGRGLVMGQGSNENFKPRFLFQPSESRGSERGAYANNAIGTQNNRMTPPGSARGRGQDHRGAPDNGGNGFSREQRSGNRLSNASTRDQPLFRKLVSNGSRVQAIEADNRDLKREKAPRVEHSQLSMGERRRRHSAENSGSGRSKTGSTNMTEDKEFSAFEDVEPVIVPMASTYEVAEDLHRKRSKEDRRARRSDRYDEIVEDVDDKVPRNHNTAKGSARGRDFDYAAFEAEDALYAGGRKKKKAKGGKQNVDPTHLRPTLQIPEFLSVERLARMLKVDLDLFIEKLEEEGFEGARYDHILDSGTSAMFAELYGFEPILAGTGSGSVADLVPRPPPNDASSLPSRPPIVTIMGHVDHGKTTILDYLRKSSVVDTEHGGITQHIGAFSVTMPGSNRQITFLDTPGHAAFLEMRRRGANVTDIVVLVVAADDSVKPQTIEAIKHSLEANVQLIVAINKVDKPEADIERVKQDLTRHDIVVEDYGGDYQVIPVSGKTGQGMSELEEAIITLADVNDFRAETDGPAEGWVIESKVTTAGRVATILVRRGTLRTGDVIVAGTTWARVRTLRTDAGVLVSEAPPGTPVQVDGWRGADPTAGLEVLQASDEDHAKDVVDLRLEREENMKTVANMAAINTARTEEADARAKVVAWEREQDWAKKYYGQRPKDNEGWVEAADTFGPQKVHFVVKADVAGSVEALVAAVSAIGNHEVVANVIHSGTGPLSESDMRMLATTGEKCYAISFNQGIDNSVGRLAEAADISILDHNIIYKVTDNVREILAERLPPIVTQRVLGEAEIGQVFEITMKRSKVKIAGCRVTNGTISRSHKIRVQRKGETVFTGSLSSLKNVKKDVTEMRKGTECGMGFEEWEEFAEGDQVQCFEEHHEKRQLF